MAIRGHSIWLDHLDHLVLQLFGGDLHFTPGVTSVMTGIYSLNSRAIKKEKL